MLDDRPDRATQSRLCGPGQSLNLLSDIRPIQRGVVEQVTVSAPQQQSSLLLRPWMEVALVKPAVAFVSRHGCLQDSSYQQKPGQGYCCCKQESNRMPPPRTAALACEPV